MTNKTKASNSHSPEAPTQVPTESNSATEPKKLNKNSQKKNKEVKQADPTRESEHTEVETSDIPTVNKMVKL